MTTILIVAAIMACVIFVHELGHFLAGKLFKTRIETFSIGFGSKLISKKIGETEYCISAIPFGGYVKFAGPDHVDDLNPKDSNNHQYLVAKPTWQRGIIYVAGVTFNFLFAILIMTGMLYQAGKIPVATNIIAEVVKNSPAAKAGFQKGDKIVALNNARVSNWNDVAILLYENGGKSVRFGLSRNSRSASVTVTPEFVKKENRYLFGFSPQIIVQEIGGLPAAFKWGISMTWDYTKLQAKGLSYLITQKVSAKNLGGPIAIFKATADAAKQGWGAILGWLFTFNVLLGFFNILPIPILDGGHLAFVLIETVRGKPLSKQIQAAIMNIGFWLIMMLVLFATFNDVGRMKP